MSLRISALCLLILLLAGATRAAPTYTWGHGYGDSDTQNLWSVATDPTGNVLICGSFYSTITIKSTLTSAGMQDAFIAKLDSDGNALWNHRVGVGTFDDIAWDVTSDKDGNVIAVGAMSPTVGNRIPVGIVKYAPDGTQLWIKTFGANQTNDAGQFVATDLAGNIIVAGHYQDTIDFGGGSLSPPFLSSQAMFLVKFDPNGNHIWSETLGDDYAATAGMEADATGNVVLFGQFQHTIDFGLGALTSAGLNDLFLVKFASDGRALWNHRFGNAGLDPPACLALAPDGRAAIAENLDGAVDFGGGPLTPTGSPQPAVAVYAPDGSYMWSKTFTATTYAFGYGMTFAENNDLVLACNGSGSIDFGGGPVAASGVFYNVFVARLSASNGAHRWSFSFAGDDNVYGFPAIAHGQLIVAGYMDGAADPGGGPLPYGGATDVFVAGYDETLTGAGAPRLTAVLDQNIPNPFNPTTSIPYTLARSMRVVIGIYDVSGARVARLDQGVQSPGAHAATWNGRDGSGRAVASGVYFYRMEGSAGTPQRKMMLLK
ncbi:MAG TPA: FlgD immunoglobulin-like domain containing protein [Candidatus Krumholzibacteria bacterium]|nr:FlgD immunoglobulin-like domain containing protein [Candidatus Krumholzibacteria bacterium]